jgi:hypothetical protein
MSILSDKYVFGFKFTIYNTILVKHLNTIENFCNKTFNNSLIENNLLLLEIEVNIALVQILHDDVDFVLVLKGFSN